VPSEVAAEPSAGCRAGSLAAVVGQRRTLVVAGLARSYLVDAPAGAADAPLPLVLAFHGFRHSAAGLRDGIGLAERAAAGAFVAVHAEGREGVRLLDTTGRGWDTGPDDAADDAFVRAILDAVEAERCIDRRRIYALGFSNGGFVSNLLGCRLADRLAAVAPVAGARALDACTPAAPRPILFFHGRADRIVPPRLTAAAVAWWRRANRCGDGDDAGTGCHVARGCAADVAFCEGPQAHTWPRDATDRIWEFFRAHPRRD
jgi:polyhydroxybutyrate depolymerase